ncbi:MAG: peptidoglycan DD-metalloendopeptidase family protein [Thermoleophilia bacterium]|nr:peptidoglycan DD-metalloendopeptidase family protein [Thermoleophilia bacterium]
MNRRFLLVLPILASLCAVAVVVSIAAAAPGEPEASAAALVTRVTQPGLADEVSLALTAPPRGDQVVANYAYPADGSIVQLSSAGARVVAQPGVSSIAQSGLNVASVSLLGGEISADAIDLRASVAAGPANASVDVPASSVTGLVVLGQLITPTPNAVVPLADWGTLEILASSSETTRKAPRSASTSLTALRIKVTADHGGLPAGSTIEIGSVSTSTLAAAPVVPVKQATKPTVAPPASRPVVPANAPREPGKSIAGAPPELVRVAPEVTAQLSSGGYVFPVYGPASFGDTFGAPRSDVPGGWHHGEDIFSPLGTPLLAVADGTVFSVGWNDIGGWRLWLRDRVGNEFYYAHLSAYSPLAVNGKQVRAGDVLGFMGKTGDAEFTPVHVHFEIHPVSLLSLGYDGAVAPYPFLNAWRRAEDVSFDAGRAYLPLDGPAGSRGAIAPPAGAVLLEASDISSSSGLTPGSLKATLTGRAPKSKTGGGDR